MDNIFQNITFTLIQIYIQKGNSKKANLDNQLCGCRKSRDIFIEMNLIRPEQF